MSINVSALRKPAATAGGLAASLMALGLLASANPDLLLEQSFERAIGATQPSATAIGRVAISSGGSEDDWLREPPADPHIVPARTTPLVPGDKITISSSGRDRVLEVTEIAELPSGMSRIGSSKGPQTRLYIVTCREQNVPGAASVRFVWDARNGWPALLAGREQATL